MNYNTYTGYQYIYFTKTFTKNDTLLGLVNVPQFPYCYSSPKCDNFEGATSDVFRNNICQKWFGSNVEVDIF